MSVHPGPIVGAVLCGCASRRMGRDKALVEVDGVPMARRVADALAMAGCAEVVAVGGDAAAIVGLGLDVLPDEFPGEGPLGGVITALRQWPGAGTVVVVACDLPHLTADSLSAVIAALTPERMAAIGRTDRLQPLVGAWRPQVLPVLEQQFAAGERKLQTVVRLFPTAEVALPAHDLTNVNTPDDLRQ